MNALSGYARLEYDLELQDEHGNDIDMHANGIAAIDDSGEIVEIGVYQWDQKIKRYSQTCLTWWDRGSFFEIIKQNIERQLPDEVARAISDDHEIPRHRWLREYL